MARHEDEHRPGLDLPAIPLEGEEQRERFEELEAQERLTDEGGPAPAVEEPNAETGISRVDAPAQ